MFEPIFLMLYSSFLVDGKGSPLEVSMVSDVEQYA